MIIPAKKIRIITNKENEEDFINKIQLSGKLMLLDDSEEQVLSSEQQHLKEIENAIRVLEKYQKRKFFEYHEVTVSEFNDVKDEASTILREVDYFLSNKESNSTLLKEKENLIKLLKPYENLEVSLNDLNYLTKSKVVFGSINLNKKEELLKIINKNYSIIESQSIIDDYEYLSIIIMNMNVNEVYQSLNALGFNEDKLPLIDDFPKNIIDNLIREVSEINIELKDNEKNIVLTSNKLNILKTYYDYAYNKLLEKNVKLSRTEKTIYIEGWLAEDKVLDFTNEINEYITCDVEILDITDDDNTPTITRNNKFVTQFETITNMFSPPNKDEIDPNPVMSIWYWLIFGIMMGDIGYGLVLIIVFTLFSKLVKPKGDLKSLSNVFALSGISAVIFGILFGSLFGFSFDLLKEIGSLFGNPNLTSVVLDPINNPIPMLIVSLIIGVFHIMSGLIIKLVLELRRKNYVVALVDAVSWILILIGIGMFILVKPIYIGISLVVIGALLILVLTGHEQKGVISKTISGLGGLYNASGYLSDILSYSRILALSLSTAVIAFTMNMLANMVAGGIIGYFFAGIIYIIGHAFNFAMGLLSTYVHDGRLQYLEFYGKFYEGEGTLFKPFQYELKYINKITKERK